MALTRLIIDEQWSYVGKFADFMQNQTGDCANLQIRRTPNDIIFTEMI